MFAKLGFARRLLLSIAVGVAGMLVILALGLHMLYDALAEERMRSARDFVQSGVVMLKHFHALESAGTLTREAAQKQAVAALRGLRSGEDGKGYLWINDMAPRSVMHPVKPELEGKDVSDVRDGRGEKLYAMFVDTVRQKNAGYVQYWYLPPGAAEGRAKQSYVQGFAPWGWVVGSGVAMEDLRGIWLAKAADDIVVTLLLIVVLGAMAAWIGRGVLRQLGGDPAYAADVARRIAGGDLSVPVAANGARVGLVGALADMQDGLRMLVTQVTADATRVSSSVEKLSAEANEISLAAKIQSGATQQTRESVDQVGVSVRRVSGLADETEQHSRRVAELSAGGELTVREAAHEMDAIAQTMAGSAERIRKLDERAQQIGKIAQVIKEIADQTNLLALNAAIEAARAGEQGRGFAVVADEVRKLAERTGAATQEIGATIAAIQSDTGEAVAAMQSAKPLIDSGLRRAAQAAEALVTIRREAEATQGKFGELAQATHLQSEQLVGIVSNVHQVTDSSLQTEKVVERTLSTAVLLENAAEELFEVVARFRLGDAAAGPAAAQSAREAPPLIRWSAALSVGHGEIDRQHQRLVELINALNAAMLAGQGRDAIGRTLDELVSYTVEHFAYEERQMSEHGYADTQAHVAQHRKLVAEVGEFVTKFRSGKAVVSIELMSFLRDWLTGHILKTDRKLGDALAGRR